MEQKRNGMAAWGPVSRGFTVSFPDGEHGSVEEIHPSETGAQLVVNSGWFPSRPRIVDASEIAAILPPARRVILREDDADRGVAIVAGIVRMPPIGEVYAAETAEVVP